MSTKNDRSGVVMLGKPVADAIAARLLADVPDFVARHKLVPKLAIVLVGSNAPSVRYVGKKIEACARLHMKAELRQTSFMKRARRGALRAGPARRGAVS